LNSYQPKSPRGIGWLPFYYRYKNKEGLYQTNIETELFSKIEDACQPIFSKINSKQQLDPEEKQTLALFIAFQNTRIPDFQKKTEKLLEKMYKSVGQAVFYSIDKTKEILGEDESKEINREGKVSAEEMFNFVKNGDYKVGVNREFSIKSMLKVGQDTAGYLLQMNWIFLCCPTSTSFITSDSPFFIIPPQKSDDSFWSRGVGILTPGATKIIPLSAGICLAMGNKGELLNYMEIDRKETRTINQMIAENSDRYIIAESKSLLERIIKDTKVDQWLKGERIAIG